MRAAATVSRPVQLFTRRWTAEAAASAIKEFGPLASYADLHDLTGKFSWQDRMALYDGLPTVSREAMATSLHATLERERKREWGQ